MTKYTAKNVLLQLEDGTKVLPYTDKLSRDLSNINSDGENKLIASRVYRAKDVLSDIRGAETLEAEKRSTFDRSKFTVVGSPTISDDGIVSGFSGNNYLALMQITTDDSSTINVQFTIPNNITGNQGIIGFESSSSGTTSFGITPTNILLFRSHLGNIFSFKNTLYSAGDLVNVTMDFKNKKAVLNNITKSAIHDVDMLSTYSLTENISTIGYSFLGVFYGSIDLKQFSITVDGKEVFNSNKTGIDKIKKDDYVKVGSPVISNDGIASGFNSESNYLKLENFNTALGSNFKFIMRITTPSDLNQAYGVIRLQNGALFLGTVTSDLSYSGLRVQFGDGTTTTTWARDNLIPGSVIKPNTEYIIEFGISNNKVFSRYKRIGYAWSAYNEVDANGVSVPTFDILTIGKNAGTPFYGSIDLNDFKIYINNQLSHQATLKIPYTQSKTGNKIVDSVYRDRVQDMYEQFGYTHYYTIGDEPGKYNVGVVGSPTLVGGVASGFSSGNYLETLNINFSNSWTAIFGKVILSTLSTGSNIVGMTSTNNRSIQITALSNATQIRLSSNGSSWDIANGGDGGSQGITYIKKLPVNTYFYPRLSFNGSKYILDISTDLVSWDTYIEVTSTSNIYNSQIAIGCTKSDIGYLPLQGQIDLSQFSITVDGKEVFRGYEPTISNAFTLPTNKPSDIIYEVTGADSGYMQYADLTVEQYGKIPASTTSVNLPIAYKDANYNLNVHYIDSTNTSNTTVALTNGVRSASSFTTGTSTLTRQYNTSGKIVLG